MYNRWRPTNFVFRIFPCSSSLGNLLTTAMADGSSRSKRNDVYFLVHWLGEDSVSVVFSGKVKVKGEAQIGKECVIHLGKKSYTGEIIAIGTKQEMKIAEEEETLDDMSPKAKSPSSLKQTKKIKENKKTDSKDKDLQSKKKARKQNILVVSSHGGINEKQICNISTPSSSSLPVNITTASPSSPVTYRATTSPSFFPVTTAPSSSSLVTIATTPLLPPSVSTFTGPASSPLPVATMPSLLSGIFITSSPSLPVSTTTSVPSPTITATPSSILSLSSMELSPIKADHELEIRLNRIEDTQQNILHRLGWLESFMNNMWQQQYPYMYPQSYRPYNCPTASFTATPVTTSINSTQTTMRQYSTGVVENSPADYTDEYPVDVDEGQTVNEPYKIKFHANKNSLPSSVINKQSLRSVEDVLKENIHLRTESCAGTLCQKLAKEAIFGEDIMKQCTPYGTRDAPGLPREELYSLKTIMFRQFPRFLSCPHLFEATWKKCIGSVEQACKRIRLKERKN